MKYLFAVLLQIFLIALNAVCACAEIAIISMNETKLNILSARGGKDAKKARKISKLTADPARFLSTIQVAITLAGFLGSAFAADMFAEPLVNAILSTGIGIPASVISPICVILITLILAFFNIVFGELIPKRIAMNKAEGVAKSLSGFLLVISIIFKPVVWLLTVSTNGMLRLFGISPNDKGDEVTEEDILMMAQVGKESGTIEGEENEMIKNIFQFNDLSISEICTHRKDVDAVFTTDSSNDWKEKILSTSHTHYLVCGENVDEVKGVLSTKAYFRLDNHSIENVLKNAVQTPLYLYENTPANKVFEKMKSTHEYFGVVLDEYGGVTGIVTIHDLLEALVGDMNEKNEEEEYTIKKIEENTWEISGIAPFYKVEDVLSITIDVTDDTKYETFNGYILGVLQEVPDDGSTFSLSTKQMDIQVLEIEKQRIMKAIVRVKQL